MVGAEQGQVSVASVFQPTSALMHESRLPLAQDYPSRPSVWSCGVPPACEYPPQRHATPFSQRVSGGRLVSWRQLGGFRVVRFRNFVSPNTSCASKVAIGTARVCICPACPLGRGQAHSDGGKKTAPYCSATSDRRALPDDDSECHSHGRRQPPRWGAYYYCPGQ